MSGIEFTINAIVGASIAFVGASITIERSRNAFAETTCVFESLTIAYAGRTDAPEEANPEGMAGSKPSPARVRASST